MQAAKTIRLRLLGYIGVNFNALLIPLLIYQFTHSTLLAGVSLLVEWTPKLGFYLLGGAMAARISCKRAHVWLEGGRLLAFLAMLGVILNVLPWYVLMVAASIYQATNAISNIIFENLVTHWWAPDQRTAGHSRLMRADLEAGILATGLGILFNDSLVLILCGLAIQVLTLTLVYRWRSEMHAEAPSAPLAFGQLLEQTWQAIPQLDRKLVRLALISLAVGLPAATIFSVLPFFLGSAFPEVTIGPRELALVTLGRSILTLGVVRIINRGMAHWPAAAGRFALGGAALAILGAGLCAIGQSYWALAGLLVTGWAGYCYSPWARACRQAWLPAEPSLRLSLTGILISVEACSYLLGAGLIALSDQNMRLLAVSAIIPLLLSATLALPWIRAADHTAGIK